MILASGAFDGLHAGHVRYLQMAKRLGHGQPLHVAVAPDAYIRAEKGREPYWSQADRMQTVFALACVDEVIPQHDTSVAKTVREKRPTALVKGPDWKGHLPQDVIDACVDVGARILYTETGGRHVREARG